MHAISHTCYAGSLHGRMRWFLTSMACRLAPLVAVAALEGVAAALAAAALEAGAALEAQMLGEGPSLGTATSAKNLVCSRR